MSSGTDLDLYGLSGNAADNIYALGARGLILNYVGTEWRPAESGTDRDLNSVWVSEEGTPWAAGDGVIWTP